MARHGQQLCRKVRSHRDLDVYRAAFGGALTLFELSKGFPSDEMYSLTSQIRRSSRSVCGNLAEAWRKRRYTNAFISKLSDAEAEAAETQVWIEFAVRCGYVDRAAVVELYGLYERVIGTLVGMINHPHTWVIAPQKSSGVS